MICLITGCLLVKDRGDLAVWGDLHQLGDCYVFNAVLNAHGEADWNPDHVLHSHLKYLELAELPFPSFERRGVITFPKYAATLSAAALTYIRTSDA